MNKISMCTDHCISNEPDDCEENYICTTPSDRIYFQGRRDGKAEGIEKGIDEGEICVYYEEMKMSPEDIAKKMNKPLDMVKKVIKGAPQIDREARKKI